MNVVFKGPRELKVQKANLANRGHEGTQVNMVKMVHEVPKASAEMKDLTG